MRTIKLRAWDPVGLNIKGEPTGRMTFGTVEYFDDMLGFRFEHFQGDTEDIVFEQFTGLLDKQGNEIYEGDIVKYRQGVAHWDGGYTKPTVVEFNNGSFSPFCGCGGEYSMSVNETEVIGNVHENPELLTR